MTSKVHVQATINGEEVEFLCETRQSLLEVLRDVLGFTGSKEGCNNGNWSVQCHTRWAHGKFMPGVRF